MRFDISDYPKIKLIIWDLDETLWSGTLSEGCVSCAPETIQLLRELTQTGIVNSICSKNDTAQVQAELEALGIADLFVFNSVNWEAKGPRIQKMIADMQLRPANVLFVDDNSLNLAQAEYACPGIMTAGPEILDMLRCRAAEQFAAGIRKNRLPQYRILETKRTEQQNFSSDTEFLAASDICVVLCEDCLPELQRIWELNKRANQLNFTKDRIPAEELERLICDPAYRCGTVRVSDRYGDYGIADFYCVDLQANRLLHFCFSCRTMGMGVEQYVYRQLGCPLLTIVGEVVSDPAAGPAPDWINQHTVAQPRHVAFSAGKQALFKGPCDLWSVCNFFSDTHIVTEFTYTISKNNTIDYGLNHTENILNAERLSAQERAQLEQTLPFVGEKTFSSEIFSGGYPVVLLSVLIDGMLGVYRSRESGHTVAFGDWCTDLTEEENWPHLLDGTLETYGCPLDEPFLRKFRLEYSYLGRLPVEQTVENIRSIRARLPKETVLVLLLGSEVPYLKNTNPVFFGREVYNSQLNDKLKTFCMQVPNTFYLDPTPLITGQGDFTDSITHFRKPVYYRMAEQINQILSESNYQLQQKGKGYLLMASVRQQIWRNSFVRKVYYKIRERHA